MAGIIKRGNKWIAVVRSLDGKELRKTTGIDVAPKALLPGTNKRAAMAQNEARARLVAEEMEKEVRYGVFDLEKVKAIAGESAAALKAGRNGMSAGKFLLDWLEGRRNKRGAIERDGVAVRRFLDFLGDGRNMVLTAVNKGMAKDFVERELERVSAGTVIRYVSTLSAAFNVAVDRELIPRNPFRGVMPSKADHQAEKQLRGAFTLDEVKRLLAVMPGEWPEQMDVPGLSQIAAVLAGTRQDPLVRPNNGNPAPIEFDGIEPVQEDKERRPGVLDGVENKPLV